MTGGSTAVLKRAREQQLGRWLSIDVGHRVHRSLVVDKPPVCPTTTRSAARTGSHRSAPAVDINGELTFASQGGRHDKHHSRPQRLHAVIELVSANRDRPLLLLLRGQRWNPFVAGQVRPHAYFNSILGPYRRSLLAVFLGFSIGCFSSTGLSDQIPQVARARDLWSATRSSHSISAGTVRSTRAGLA